MAPIDQPLVDGHGRVATDLRVSLTDRCNLRCQYCMPAEGLDWMPTEETLTDDELMRLIGIGVERLGIQDVRFTGGEPLLRRGLPNIIAATKALRPTPRTAITSNGLGLKRTAQALADAGLDRVNISLDTTDPETFVRITRRDRLPDVIDGLAAAADAGLAPVKVNAVLLRGINDEEASDLLRWCMKHEYELRFIEQMPLDAQHGWQRDEMVTADETLPAGRGLPAHAARRARLGAGREVPGRRRPAHRRHHRLGDASVLRRLQPGTAHRRRPDPQLPLRARGVGPASAAARRCERRRPGRPLEGGDGGKLPGHGINDPSFLQPTRPMSSIGG